MVWAYSATQFSRPISALIDATEKVRSGDLGVRVPEDAETKELGLLSRAFNRMTGELGQVAASWLKLTNSLMNGVVLQRLSFLEFQLGLLG